MALGFLLPSAEQAVIWRGLVKIGLINQFVRDVAWEDLDFFVVDCPPRTGDEPLSALQTLGQDAQAVIVTTPQGVAIDDVRRSVSFCREVGNPVLGIVENMSGYVSPYCGKEENVSNTGRGEALAKEMQVSFLGRVLLDPELVRAGDEGYAFTPLHGGHRQNHGAHSQAGVTCVRTGARPEIFWLSQQSQKTPLPFKLANDRHDDLALHHVIQ